MNTPRYYRSLVPSKHGSVLGWVGRPYAEFSFEYRGAPYTVTVEATDAHAITTVNADLDDIELASVRGRVSLNTSSDITALLAVLDNTACDVAGGYIAIHGTISIALAHLLGHEYSITLLCGGTKYPHHEYQRVPSQFQLTRIHRRFLLQAYQR